LKAALNKQKFTQIVQDHHGISAEDRNKLQELVSNYPYSQIIHTLIAKANMDANTEIAKQTLGYAAMYSTDRGLLKDIIKKKPPSRGVKTEVKPVEAPQKQEEVKQEAPTPKKTSQPKTKLTVDPDAVNIGDTRLYDQVLADLSALKESKASYMAWLDMPDEPAETEPETTAPTKKETKKKPAKTKPKSATSDKSKKSTKASAATTKEKKEAKKKEVKETAKKETKKTHAKVKSSTKEKKENTKSKKKPSPKSKKTETASNDQSKIIDKFISKEPSITAKTSRKSPTNQEDLSEPSTEFTEDLISENLAKIMITQGKTDKAIDIYKKLIWKFPQKKAYFATQIEELKK